MDSRLFLNEWQIRCTEFKIPVGFSVGNEDDYK